MGKLKIGITGASGFVGKHLVSSLNNLQFDIVAFQRQSNSDPGYHNAVSIRPFKLGETLRQEQFSDIDFIIHLAFEFKPKRNDSDDENLVSASELVSLNKPILFVSSFSAIPPSFSTYYGRTKEKIEDIFRGHCILRPGLVIGNGGLFKSIWKQLTLHSVLPILSKGEQPLQLIHIEDLCACIQKCILDYKPNTYHLAHPQHISYKEFIQGMAMAMKRRIWLVPLPIWLVRFMFKVNSYFKLISLNEDNLIGLLESKQINTMPDYQRFNSEWKDPYEAIRCAIREITH